MRIAFFGEDSFSCTVLQTLVKTEHFDIVCCVSPFYTNKTQHIRLEKFCTQHSIPFFREKKLDGISFNKKISDLFPDLIVVAHFERLLSPEIIAIPKYGAINIHPAALPDYRGLAPQHWPIINGDSKTAVTVHFIDSTADTGDIIVQEEVEIKNTDYVTDLQKKFLTVYPRVILKAIDLIVTKKVKRVKQNHLYGRYYNKLKLEDCYITANFDAYSAYNLIRAVSTPYFGARFYDYIIWKARVGNESIFNVLSAKYAKKKINFDADMGYFILFDNSVLLLDKFDKA